MPRDRSQLPRGELELDLGRQGARAFDRELRGAADPNDLFATAITRHPVASDHRERLTSGARKSLGRTGQRTGSGKRERVRFQDQNLGAHPLRACGLNTQGPHHHHGEERHKHQTHTDATWGARPLFNALESAPDDVRGAPIQLFENLRTVEKTLQC